MRKWLRGFALCVRQFCAMGRGVAKRGVKGAFGAFGQNWTKVVGQKMATFGPKLAISEAHIAQIRVKPSHLEWLHRSKWAQNGLRICSFDHPEGSRIIFGPKYFWPFWRLCEVAAAALPTPPPRPPTSAALYGVPGAHLGC